MSKEYYMFDVDGTLTAPRRKMSTDFLMKFLSWSQNKHIFLVAGSDLDKVKDQLPQSVLSRCDGVFCSMANEFWVKGELIYKNKWEPDIELITALTDIRTLSKYDNKKEIWLEIRTGMVNFSVAGRDSSLAERERYNTWDNKNKERENIVKELSEKFHNLDFRIGGQISIDICPKGNNKSQASQWVRKNLGNQIIFLGDSCHEGGNDRDIFLDVRENEGGVAHEVKSPDDTLEILDA
tara:strand:- start:10059 stop:10769 length:711 start_codon:yes stop_codon:yes gene_type:complete